ncbi:MAG: hypothetical protein R3A51_13035 [Nannocystaceae bacterium]|nr:hypothetical protein [Myxococcales bacterium]
MTSRTIQLSVTLEQANLILEGLGLLPFVKVFELIGDIQAQARSQLNGQAPEAPPSQPPSPMIDAS